MRGRDNLFFIILIIPAFIFSLENITSYSTHVEISLEVFGSPLLPLGIFYNHPNKPTVQEASQSCTFIIMKIKTIEQEMETLKWMEKEFVKETERMIGLITKQRDKIYGKAIEPNQHLGTHTLKEINDYNDRLN